MNDKAHAYWPHAPLHSLHETGAYMVTAGTYQKQHFLSNQSRKTAFMNMLFEMATQYHWELQAWAVMSNHYHFIAHSPDTAENLQEFMLRLHTLSSTDFNCEDAMPGRKVWYQFWDKRISFLKSYLPRLKYVHENPVHHGVVRDAEDYFWCSASWFRRSADKAFYSTVMSFKTDTLNVFDNF